MSFHRQTVACHECDTLQIIPPITVGSTARGVRCNARLLSYPKGGLDTPLALILGVAVLYVIAGLIAIEPERVPVADPEVEGAFEELSVSSTQPTGCRISRSMNNVCILSVW